MLEINGRYPGQMTTGSTSIYKHCNPNIVDISGALFTLRLSKIILNSSNEEDVRDVSNIWVTGVITRVCLLNKYAFYTHMAFFVGRQSRDYLVRKEKKKDDDEEIGTAPDGRIIVREKKKVDVDMLSSDEEDGIPENIRMSDQKVRYHLTARK